MSEPARYLPLNRAELIAELERYRAKLLSLAQECSGCGGLGFIEIPPAVTMEGPIPCFDCTDIREVLNCARHPYR